MVATTVPQLDDSRVAAGALLESSSEIHEELLDQVDLLGFTAGLLHGGEAPEKLADLLLNSEAPRAVLLAELIVGCVGDGSQALGARDQPFGDAPELLGLRVGGLDGLVSEQVRCEGPKHGAAVGCIAAKLPP